MLHSMQMLSLILLFCNGSIGVVVVKGEDFVVSCSKHQHCQIVLGFFLNQKNVLVGVKQLRLIENCLYDFDNSCIYFGVVVL